MTQRRKFLKNSTIGALGAILFNPHVLTVEDGGLGVVDSDQVQAKRNYDPKGILNPGKLKGWS